MCLTLEDFQQDPELMQAASEFAKEISGFAKQKYVGQEKGLQYKSLIGSLTPWNRTMIPQALLFKLEELLHDAGAMKHRVSLEDRETKMVAEVYMLIKEKYGENITQLKRLEAVLTDSEASEYFICDFIYKLCELV